MIGPESVGKYFCWLFDKQTVIEMVASKGMETDHEEEMLLITWRIHVHTLYLDSETIWKNR
jgi:hypothetical protein